MSAPETPPDFLQRLAMIIQTLRQTIAARAGRDRRVAPIILPAWRYVHRLLMRFEALTRRVQAGDAAVARPRPRPASTAPRPKSARLPQGFAWLLRLAPEAGPLGGQLRYLLTDPDMSALLAASPQAAKILRPLCRMLGIGPSTEVPQALFSPPAPPKSRVPVAPAPVAPALVALAPVAPAPVAPALQNLGPDRHAPPSPEPDVPPKPRPPPAPHLFAPRGSTVPA